MWNEINTKKIDTTVDNAVLRSRAQVVIADYLREGEGKETVIARLIGKGTPAPLEELKTISSQIGGATISTVLDTGLGLEYLLIDECGRVLKLTSRPTQPGVLTELSEIIPVD